MANQQSLADRFVYALAEINRIDRDMPADAPERYAVWKMKEAAEEALSSALHTALKCVDAAHCVVRAANDARERDRDLKP